ncbi:MAG TPA: thiamine pyrophosphate-binding protein [Gemmataceae bacterium]|nr:thiamine pyrophosphate-binding protein [Gemmataceae bacterium]
MLDPAAAVGHVAAAGFSHIVWIPDSAVGPWEAALTASPKLKLIRPCREGEAIGIAAGLMLGGARPVVVLQCTGLFEAGDALRNVVHDLGLPLKLIVGVRSYRAYAAGQRNDNCPAFTEPIVKAWQVPYTLLADADEAGFSTGVRELAAAPVAQALLLGE